VEVIEKQRQTYNMESEILRLEPPRLLEMRFVVVGAGRTQGTYELTPEGNQTRLTFNITSVSHGWIRLFAPFLGPAIQKQIDENTGRLKQVVESGQ